MNVSPLLPALLLWLLTSVTLFCQMPARQRENLGPEVNGVSIEILPLVSPDGRTLYFDRKFDSANVGGLDDADDIYVSRLDSTGKWSPARNIGAPLNSAGSDLLFWISPDGSRALVYSDRLKSGSRCGLGIARKNGASWDPPEPIMIEGLSSLGDTYYAQISPDGRTLLLAYAPDPRKPDNVDLFSAPLAGGDLLRWGRPRGLGAALNSSFFEGAPFLAIDNRTLYFASDGHDGLGGVDLFMSRRIGNGWSQWTAPLNLGDSVNTTFTEASISIDAAGTLLYVSGDAGSGPSYGRSDIFRMPLPERFRPLPTTLVEGMLTGGEKGVRGLVIASLDGAEIATAGSDDDGRFLMALPAGARIRLVGWSAGFNETAIELTMPASRGELYPVGIALKSGPVRQPDVKMPRTSREEAPIVLLFETGADRFDGEIAGRLGGVLARLRAEPDARAEIDGHTDDAGDAEANSRLARRRAEYVKGWLVEQGIDAGRILLRSHGEERPAASNESAEGRRKNRRVEIRITGERAR